MRKSNRSWQVEELLSGTIPQHVAIIMDGNGRWASRRFLPRIEGHRAGAKSVRRSLEAAGSLGIRYLTLFTFSMENWQRPKEEVSDLMKMLEQHLIQEKDRLVKESVRLMAIGELDLLPENVHRTISTIQEVTSDGRSLNLIIALSYGSRQEILHAADGILEDIDRGKIKKKDLDEQLFSRYLYTAQIPPVDILIRTSGECRLSNFLLWQLTGAHLFFTRTLWPDFTKSTFYRAVKEYQKSLAIQESEKCGIPN